MKIKSALLWSHNLDQLKEIAAFLKEDYRLFAPGDLPEYLTEFGVKTADLDIFKEDLKADPYDFLFIDLDSLGPKSAKQAANTLVSINETKLTQVISLLSTAMDSNKMVISNIRQLEKIKAIITNPETKSSQEKLVELYSDIVNEIGVASLEVTI